ncbi:MAG: hypothetical protein KGH65_01390 [Candidatus Micrarchaeota archaeon]|nr:hypothetical protein [Candidatus Micrarchaeota archaeon]
MNNRRQVRLQSSFELLITLSFGLAILLPLVVFAFIQLANANSAVSAVAAQQVASKLASAAALVGSQGAPAKQIVQIAMPTGVQYIYIGTLTNGIGHSIIFAIRSPTGLSYITAYTPINVSGNLGGISSTGTYLVNVSAQAQCPLQLALPCVYMKPAV